MKKILILITFLLVLICCEVVSAGDPAASVNLTPQNPQVGLGEVTQITAQGYDNQGNPQPILNPNWEWDTRYGTLVPCPTDNCKANFFPTSPGDCYVRCYEGNPWDPGVVFGETTVKIVETPQPYLARIEVEPSVCDMKGGESWRFTATGYDQYGQVFPITPTWSATGGTINQNGLYTAPPREGRQTVTASFDGKSGAASVTVLVPRLTTCVVSPNNLKAEKYQLLTFYATGFDQYGEVFPGIQWQWSWEGSVRPNNIYGDKISFHAVDYGAFKVTAFYTPVTGTASGTVINPVIGNIKPTSIVNNGQNLINSLDSNNPVPTSQKTNVSSDNDTNHNNSSQSSNNTSPLIYLGGALLAFLVALGIYKLW